VGGQQSELQLVRGFAKESYMTWHTAEAEKRYLAISLESMKALHHQKF
jgi:hypothetical protein